jgi:hypothetical protein
VGRQPARVPATPVRQLVLLLKRVATTWPRTGAVAHAATRYDSNERAGAAEIERTKHARDGSEASRLAVAQARLLAVSETFRALVEIHTQVYGRDATSSSKLIENWGVLPSIESSPCSISGGSNAHAALLST